jgi:hypothetical protein
MGVPGFTAKAALAESRGGAPVMGFIDLSGGAFLWFCFHECMVRHGVGSLSAGDVQLLAARCAAMCGIPYTATILADYVAWARAAGLIPPAPPTTPPTPPAGAPTIGGIAALAAAVLAAIAAGAAVGYVIEKTGAFTVAPPAQPVPGAWCAPVGPNTQRQVTESTHFGCARSESLARVKADNVCKALGGSRCPGACMGGRRCVPYARVWNTVTVPAGGFVDALWNGCSTTAYYTCQCGCE